MSNASEEAELAPPRPRRVAARALVLSVVSCRGFVEEHASEAAGFWSRVLRWFDDLGVRDEAEEQELRVVHTPLAQLGRKDQVYATWRAEGLVVLAWALRRFELPPYDQQVVAAEVANSLGFLEQATVLDQPELRDAIEMRELSESMFSAHWRLAEYNLSPRSMDFATFAKTAWFGPLSLAGLRLAHGDLAIGDLSISRATSSARHLCYSTVSERRQAADWLLGTSPLYSEVSLST